MAGGEQPRGRIKQALRRMTWTRWSGLAGERPWGFDTTGSQLGVKGRPGRCVGDSVDPGGQLR